MDLFTWNWKKFLPLLLFPFLFLFEEWVSIPSCTFVPRSAVSNQGYDVVVGENSEEDLRVMMVANLLLLGSESGFFNQYFRDYYMSKFFRKSFHSLKPDMLLILGDVSAKGFEMTKSKWGAMLHQFHNILGPFIDLPLHVVLGDRDVGECSKLDARSVQWIARGFPGLDSAGCGAFGISNVSFVSLNAVALLCGNNKLRFSVERAIETESIDVQLETEATSMDDYGNLGEVPLRWRANEVSYGSGPVLLLHFPLHKTAKDSCTEFEKAPSSFLHGSNALKNRGSVGSGPYDLLDTLPANATEYIFQALKPRIIFSAHTHSFHDYNHPDGTREITVPAMSWRVRDDPSFVLATFHSNGKSVSVSYCSLARESHVLIVYICFVILFLTISHVENIPLRWLR
ncbi:uncharacterized protein [Euphorbia lathyris]|uniref:uncharacterized protein n=1 Tax=Euphorbia lathyris TaxID=212925 RepID=UPI0033132FDA